MTLEERVPLAGGEGRVFSEGATGTRIEIELEGRVHETRFDPRETGTLVFVGFHAWPSHPEEIVGAGDRARIIDALWQILGPPHTARGILEYVAAGSERHYVLRRSDDPRRVLARLVAGAVELVRLEHTVLVPGTEVRSGGQHRFVVQPERARCVEPPDGPQGRAAWDEFRESVSRLEHDDWYLTDFPRHLVEA